MKNLQVEGLRGGTILMIVLYHLICRYQQIFHMKDIVAMKRWGEFGVIIFLIISCYFMNGKESDSFKISDYLRKKVLRLWPCYMVSLTITFLVVNYFKLPGRTTSISDYFLNLIWINGYVNTPYVDGSYWYLTVMLLFAVIVGVIRQFRLSYKVTIFFLIIALICDLAGLGELQAFAWIRYAGAMCVGVALWHKKNGEFYGMKKMYVVIIIAFLYTLIISGKIMFLELVGAYVLVSKVIDKKVKLFETPILMYYGEISYPLYLIHQNIAYVIMFQLELYYKGFSYWFCVVAFVSVNILAIIEYYIVEKPRKKIS